jgi:hypothetical protein
LKTERADAGMAIGNIGADLDLRGDGRKARVEPLDEILVVAFRQTGLEMDPRRKKVVSR